jgi:hypothetical protein
MSEKKAARNDGPALEAIAARGKWEAVGTRSANRRLPGPFHQRFFSTEEEDFYIFLDVPLVHGYTLSTHDERRGNESEEARGA